MWRRENVTAEELDGSCFILAVWILIFKNLLSNLGPISII